MSSDAPATVFDLDAVVAGLEADGVTASGLGLVAQALEADGQRPRAAAAHLASVGHALAEGAPLVALAGVMEARRLGAPASEVAAAIGAVHGALASARADPAHLPPLPPRPVAPGRAALEAVLACLAPPSAVARPVPLLSELSEGDLTAVVQVSHVRRLPEGQALFQRGDAARSLYFVVRGGLEIVREGAASARVTSPAVVGELSLLLGAARTRTALALADTVLIELSATAVEGLSQRASSLGAALAALGRARIVRNVVDGSPLFRALPVEARRELLAAFSPQVVEDGAVLIEEGAAPSGLFVVAAGEVRVDLRDADGDRRVVARLAEGEVFGEIALLGEQPATATVRTVGKAVVFVLPRAVFPELVSARPALRAYLEQLAEARVEANRIERAQGAESADELIVT